MSAAPNPGAYTPRRAADIHSLARDLLAWAALAAAVLTILWPLGLTNRVLAGLDAFTYFQPYWAYRDAVLRAGRLPLWNPYLFLGVPFLANIQAAVLYPLHWPLMWMQAERALIWSTLLHIWLAAGFTYVLARRSLQVSRLGAWLAGLLYGLGGFALSRVENINQLNAVAWLPAMLWLYDETARSTSWRRGLRWGIGLTLAIAMQFLAGHTQTAFVNLAGLGLYALYAPAKWAVQQLSQPSSRRRSKAAAPANPAQLTGPESRLRSRQPGRAQMRALLPLLAVLPALALVAAQLLPSLELNRLGLRTEGLPYRQAVSFSLRPRLLAQSFLPPFGGGLAEAFASEGYAEFVAYVGITGLVLAGVAIARLARSRSTSKRKGRASSGDGSAAASRGRLLCLALAGFLLGLGAYNPFYYLLWRLIPGFDLFRAPVRWLELTALGLALLSGIGLDEMGRQAPDADDRTGAGGEPEKRSGPSRRALVAALLLLVGLGLLLIYQQWPGTRTILLWILICAWAGAGVWAGRRRPRAARAGLVALAVLELWLASRALPFTSATAPYVFSLRSAPATLLAKMRDQSAAGRDRFLSMSDTRYDPGDLSELRDLMAGKLPPDAVERLVRGAKQTEVIAPNLSLRLQLPGIDGYDGGLLPTQDYGKLQTLFLAPEQRLADGRMREQLRQIPPGNLLDLTGVRFVITDKQNDLWADNVYYDLEQAARIEPGASAEFDLRQYPRFPATGLGVVSHLEGETDPGVVVGEVATRTANGQKAVLPLRAGMETATGQGPAGDARMARPWPDWTGVTGHDYLSILELPEPMIPTGISVHVPATATTTFVLQGLSLIDKRTGDHASVTISPRGDFRRIHTGDVKIYERTGTPGRAWLVHGIQPVADDDEALRVLTDPAFDPKQIVLVKGNFAPQTPGGALNGEKVEVLDFRPERVHLRAEVSQPAMLVLADAFYPGWRATVDGVPAPIAQANLMFRGVALAPGSHDVWFSFEPSSVHWGMIVSLATLAILIGAVIATYIPTRQGKFRAI